MNSLTKRVFIFIFAVAVVFSGIYLIFNYNKNAGNGTGQTGSVFNAPGGSYSTDGPNTWQYADYIDDDYESGSGTDIDPFLITTEGQFAYMASRINTNQDNTASTYFKLENNLDLSDYYWIPIGRSSAPFRANFDGNNKTINGLYIGNPSSNPVINANLQYAGLFGYASGSVISNVNVECYVQISRNNSYIGGIVGYGSNLILKNCTVLGEISADQSSNSYIGGIIGYSSSAISIDFCANFANFSNSGIGNSASCTVGGIIGWINSGGGTITNCCNFGNVNFTSANRVGGIIGDFYGYTTIDSCINTGNFEISCAGSSYTDTGGIIGWARDYFLLTNSYSTGDIIITSSPMSSTAYGGLVGYSGSGEINNCFAAGNIIINNETPAYSIGFLVGTGSIEIINSFYNTSAEMVYDYGNVPIEREGGYSDTENGRNEEYLFSQEFVDYLNEHNGVGGAEWVYTGGFPTLSIDARYELSIMFVDNFPDQGNPGGHRIVFQLDSGNCNLPEQPVYDEYSFMGWFANPDGTGLKITAQTTIEELKTYIAENEIEDPTFYAHWVPTTISYNFTVELYDNDGNLIENIAVIETLISSTNFTLDENDMVSNAVKYLQNKNNGYRFLYFSVNGILYEGESGLVGYDANHFSLSHENGEEIVIEAHFMLRYKLSFLEIDNPTMIDDQGNYNAFVYTDIKGNYGGDREIRGFFENWFDAGTRVTIDYITFSGKAVLNITPGSSFILNGDTIIKIEIGESSISLNFEVEIAGYEGDIPDTLMPYLQNDKTDFSATDDTMEVIMINKVSTYSLTKYELWLNGVFIVNYYFNMDANGYSSFNIPSLLAAGPNNDIPIYDASYILIKAVYEYVVSLSFSYISSNSGMGNVEIYKIDGDDYIKVEDFDSAGKSSMIKYNDEILIRLIPNAGYKVADENGFINGEKRITVNGNMKINIKFDIINYSLSIDNHNSSINDSAVINENIIINLKIGITSDFNKENFSLKVNGNEISKDDIRISGNSLIILLNGEFINNHNVNNDALAFELEFSTVISTGFIIIISVGSVLLLAAAILIVIYIIKLKERKEQLRLAELSTKLGNARLSISDNIKNVREEE